jgi:hypothetical protein
VSTKTIAVKAATAVASASNLSSVDGRGVKQSSVNPSNGKRENASASPTIARKGEVLLFDPTARREDPLKGLSREKQDDIVRRIYPDALFGGKVCPDKCPDSIEKARHDGLYAPIISAYTEGHFTRSTANQQLVLVRLGECCASHAENGGSNEIVVLEGDRVVLKKSIDASDIEVTQDVDRNGLLEVVVSSSFSSFGDFVKSAAVVSLGRKRVHILKALGDVVKSSCGRKDPTPDKVQIVWVVPRHRPVFRLEERQVPCKL